MYVCMTAGVAKLVCGLREESREGLPAVRAGGPQMHPGVSAHGAASSRRRR